MRILFVSMPAPPHYYPIVPLAWSFRAAGHEVRIASQPRMIDAITRSGHTAVSAASDYDLMEVMLAALRNAPTGADSAPGKQMPDITALPPHIRRMLIGVRANPLIKLAEAMADDLVPFARNWSPDLVVGDPLMFVGPLLAELLNVPYVRILWGPNATGRIGWPGQSHIGDEEVREAWPEDLLKLYDQYGVEVRADYALRCVDPCPESMQVPGVRNRLPMRHVPYNGSAVMPTWVLDRAHRPRICVTWGTSATVIGGREAFMVPDILAATAGMDVEIILMLKSSDRELVEDVADNVRIVEDLPLNLVLPTCDAIVHPAGAGTILTAAINGVPQVAMGQLEDQPFNAAQLASTGAGVTLPPGESDTGLIKTAISAALHDESVRTAAQRLREEMLAQPTPAEIAGELEALVGDYG